MRSYSHALMTALLTRPLQRRGIPVRAGWWLLGSVLPDIPFALLSLWFFLYHALVAPLPPGQSFHLAYHRHFFEDPLWIVSHNLFHAPLVLAVLGGVAWLGRRRTAGQALAWLVLGMALHTLVDILTHHSDGPLLWFPLDWQRRFASPVSYWDPAAFGRPFTWLEHGLDALLLVMLLRPWWRARRSPASRKEPPP